MTESFLEQSLPFPTPRFKTEKWGTLMNGLALREKIYILWSAQVPLPDSQDNPCPSLEFQALLYTLVVMDSLEGFTFLPALSCHVKSL